MNIGLITLITLFSYTYQFQTIANPNLISDILVSGDSVILGTSAGILILDSSTLDEIDRLDRTDGLPYPVVISLAHGTQGVVWGLLWHHGIFSWNTNLNEFIKYIPPNYLPNFEDAVDLTLNGDTLIFITRSSLVAYSLNRTPTEPSDDIQLLYLNSLGDATEFYDLFLYQDTLYVGTNRGLYIANLNQIDAGNLYSQDLPSDTVLFVTRDYHGTFVGTANGVYVLETGHCYFCNLNKKVRTISIIGDTLFVDLYPNWYFKGRDLNTGYQWTVPLPDTVKDIRKIVKIGNRILMALGGDDEEFDFEHYDYGFGLAVLEDDTIYIKRFSGPYFQNIGVMRYGNGTLWTLGIHNNGVSPLIRRYKVRKSYYRNGQWYPIADSGRTKGAIFMDLRGTEPWLNNFLGSSSDSVGIFILDSVGAVVKEVITPASRPRLVMSFTFDSDGNAVLSYWFQGIGIYIPETDSFISTPILIEEPFSLMIDHRNWLWIGKGSGLLVYKYLPLRDSNMAVPPLNPPPGFIEESTVSCFADDGKNVWIGTWNGLAVHDGTQFRQIPDVPHAVFDIDTGGNSVFVLTEKGLFILTKEGEILDSLTVENAPLPDRPGITQGNFFLFQERNGMVVLPDSQLIFVGTSKGILKIKAEKSLFNPVSKQKLKILVIPNPMPASYDSIRILNLGDYTELLLFTLDGVKLTSTKIEQRPYGFVARGLKDLPPGLYLGVASNKKSTLTFKFAKLK